MKDANLLLIALEKNLSDLIELVVAIKRAQKIASKKKETDLKLVKKEEF